MTTSLRDVAAVAAGARIVGDPDVRLVGVTHDSRAVRPGFLFAALPGEQTDGARFIPQAVDNGAAAVMVKEASDSPLPQLVVQDPRALLGTVSAAVYGTPSSELRLAGITGTNGKTTVTYMVESGMRACDLPTGVMGTVEYRFGQHRWAAAHTTPEAPVIQETMRTMRNAGASNLVMEVSSHGLSLGRLSGCEFDVVGFTNLTQDHLDFHGDMDAYASAKMKLFTEVVEGRTGSVAVVNSDDPFSSKILDKFTGESLTVSCNFESGADLRPVSPPEFGIAGVRTRIASPWGELDLRSPMLGEHNLSNLLVALGICVSMGGDAGGVLEGLASFSAVPGRLERVPCSLGFTVLVDYAHTPDALSRVLAALRPVTEGRLICVFGCGGDRDNRKRPVMGGAVAAVADVGLVTSDNPRTEDPSRIIEMILPGMEGSGMSNLSIDRVEDQPEEGRWFTVEPDRARAIELAVRMARPQDTVLIAGKGHEDYQIIGKTKIHFDDREQAAAAIGARKVGENHV